MALSPAERAKAAERRYRIAKTWERKSARAKAAKPATPKAPVHVKGRLRSARIGRKPTKRRK